MTDTDAAQPVPLTPEDLRAISGLDYLNGLLAGRYAGSPMSALLGCRIHEVAAGRVVFAAMPMDVHTNPMGSTHGGWYGATLDTAMGWAVMSKLPAGVGYTTLEYKVNLIRALPPGTDVHVTGTVDHAGRTTAAAQGRITSPDGARLYATATTTCLILRGT